MQFCLWKAKMNFFKSYSTHVIQSCLSWHCVLQPQTFFFILQALKMGYSAFICQFVPWNHCESQHRMSGWVMWKCFGQEGEETEQWHQRKKNKGWSCDTGCRTYLLFDKNWTCLWLHQVESLKRWESNTSVTSCDIKWGCE